MELSKRKSASDCIRTLILFGFVYDVDYSYLRQYNETLGKISGNLNQIEKRISSTGNVYGEEMAEVKAIMDEVWKTQKAMLKKQPLSQIYQVSLDYLVGNEQEKPGEDISEKGWYVSNELAESFLAHQKSKFIKIGICFLLACVSSVFSYMNIGGCFAIYTWGIWRAYRLLTMNEEYWRRKKKK